MFRIFVNNATIRWGSRYKSLRRNVPLTNYKKAINVCRRFRQLQAMLFYFPFTAVFGSGSDSFSIFQSLVNNLDPRSMDALIRSRSLQWPDDTVKGNMAKKL